MRITKRKLNELITKIILKESSNKSNLIRVTRRQLKRLLREAAGERATAYYTYNSAEDTFEPLSGRTDDIYTYKVDWDSIELKDNNEVASVKILIPKKAGKDFNKSFSLKSGTENVSAGVGKLAADMFASYFEETGKLDKLYVLKSGLSDDVKSVFSSESLASAFARFLLVKVKKSGVKIGGLTGESETEEADPGESPVEPELDNKKSKSNRSETEEVYYLPGVREIKLSVKPGNFTGSIYDHVNLLSIPVTSLDPNQATFTAALAPRVNITDLVKDEKALRGIRVETVKYPDPPKGSGLSVLAIKLTKTNMNDITSAAWRNGELEINGPGFNNYYVTGLKEENGFIVPKNPIKLEDDKKQS